MTITICASLSFYKNIQPIETELIGMGFTVHAPKTYRTMKKNGNFDEEEYRPLDRTPTEKTELMRTHFNEVEKADAVLVVNMDKNGLKGYIGGNVLMELAVAFHLKKKIFLLNQPDKHSPLITEIQGLIPIVLNGQVKNIAKYIDRS